MAKRKPKKPATKAPGKAEFTAVDALAICSAIAFRLRQVQRGYCDSRFCGTGDPVTSQRQWAKRLRSILRKLGPDGRHLLRSSADEPQHQTRKAGPPTPMPGKRHARYAVVQEADGQVIGPVRASPTLTEALELALALAKEQTNADPERLRAELEADHCAADPDGGWAVYVTELDDQL